MSYFILNKVRVVRAEDWARVEKFAVYGYGGDNNVFNMDGTRHKKWELLVEGDYHEVMNSISKLHDDFRGGMIQGRWKTAESLRRTVKNQIEDVLSLEREIEEKRMEPILAKEEG